MSCVLIHSMHEFGSDPDMGQCPAQGVSGEPRLGARCYWMTDFGVAAMRVTTMREKSFIVRAIGSNSSRQ